MSQQHPSVLLTNLFLMTRTGSELHVLELARGFVRAGWQVSCYALKVAYPLLWHFLSLGVKVVEHGHEELLDQHYDVLFAQHHVVADYVWENTGITFDKVVVSSLGPAVEHEKLPRLAAEADLLLFVSEEARDANLGDLDRARSRIFPNYATPEFFEVQTRSYPAVPKRVAVVSNHVPPEVRALADASPDGMVVESFGYETRSVDITPELLARYDLVITIGRTVQACLAMGLPVYCYDSFGGPGYLALADIDLHARRNFSGRSQPTRRTPAELVDDLRAGYAAAVAELPALRTVACERYAFATLFANLLRELDEVAPRPRRGVPTEADKVKNALLCERLQDFYERQVGEATLYYLDVAQGQGAYDQEHTVSVTCHYHSLIRLSVKGLLPAGVGLPVRFDPAERPVRCTIEQGSLAPINAVTTDGTTSTFVTFDPQYDCRGLEDVAFVVEPIDERELIDMFEMARQAHDERRGFFGGRPLALRKRGNRSSGV